MKQFFSSLDSLSSFQDISSDSPTLTTGVSGSSKWHIAAALMYRDNRPGLIVTHSELSAKSIYEDMQQFFKSGCHLYPSRDPLFFTADVRSTDIAKKRLSILEELINSKSLEAQQIADEYGSIRAYNRVIILSAEALLDRLIPKNEFVKKIFTIQVEDIIEPEDLVRHLAETGYNRAHQVEGAGQFAMRGGIVDIFPINGDTAIRLEFFGDEVDSIRVLDVLSQRSGEKLENAEIFPMDDSTDTDTNVLDYLSKDTILFFDEPNYIDTHLQTLREEYEDSIKHRLLKGDDISQIQPLLTYEEAREHAKNFKTVLFSDLATTPKGFKPKNIVNFTVKSHPPLRRRPEDLKEDLSYWLNQKYRLIILVGSGRSGQQLTDSLTELGVSARYDKYLENEIPPGVATVTKGTLYTGFEYPEAKFVVITDKEMFAAPAKKRKRRRTKDGAAIDHFTDLRPGDHIVHDSHGVGIFSGIEQVVIDGLSRDYLNITYKDCSIKVHTGQMDQIQKYIGAKENLKLNKLGGSDWQKAKSRVKGAVKILAEDLVALYAKRQAAKGFVYSQDTVWQTEFEENFAHEETDDQIAAIEDVKGDMESAKIMDRLICGDVGYGKTEVAIRAAFKAVQDNKQVAYLVPTTILAQQHFLTFSKRMEDYPVKVERLSRFQTAKEQRDALARLSRGEADVVIGTHRLLSKDVQFKNLGLIIVDEEQRFGVSHKEKLKALKEDVDVLTLTATPIPRTLHLSLTGLRDMSLLNEPPGERQPVQTYVMEYNPEFVREAINREVARGGQVYYLHNRVRNIAEEAARVQALVPHAKVGFAHGQMSETELENIMMSFIEGEVHVLVCTTIIETGLDISNVNTIIVQNADFMGLSQLYQLRGRVGRSNRLAYAYLMYRKDKILDEVASKRLQTIRDFTEFGSGFKIAMRDLEIRGAGNLLGAEQHGYMDSVGYDMYCKLLAEAVSEQKGEPTAQSFETTIDLSINAYIPEYFIEDEVQKIEIYKKIAMIQTEEDAYAIQEEIEDRFGGVGKTHDLPVSVQNLISIALIKANANSIGIVSITQKQQRLVITFKGDANVDTDKLAAFVTAEAGLVQFTMAPNPYLTRRYEESEDVLEILDYALSGLR